MRAVMRKHGVAIYRALLVAGVLLVIWLTGGKTEGIAPFAVLLLFLICGALCYFRHTRYAVLPFLQLTLILIFCYDSYAVFIKYIWVLPFVLAALGYYLWHLKPKLLVGPSFLPLAAVAVATLLGGIGMISAADYFRGASLGFMAGLGPGLLISYLIVKNEVRDSADVESYFEDITWWGVTAAIVAIVYVLVHVGQEGIAAILTPPQWSNNIATMLMIAMPAPLALKKRRMPHYFLMLLMFAAIMVIGSRGGVVFAGTELFVCAFFAWRSEKDPVRRLWYRTFFIYALMAAGYILWFLLYNGMFSGGLVNSTDVRWKLLSRGVENFRENPLFGSGLGYRGNADLYSGKAGTINWYHLFPAQVLGGLGAVGVLAWGWQLITRARLAFAARHSNTCAAALCYLGLLLMSMVNPGEFCPAPYAFLAVVMFVLLEKELEIPPRMWVFGRKTKKKE